MPSLVLELQEDALDSNVSVTDLLRKVKVVASKLGVNDILDWVNLELKGYPADDDVIPDYREMQGIAKALNPLRGWLRIQFPTPELEERVSRQKSNQPISQLEEMARHSESALSFTLSSALMKGVQYAHDARIFISPTQVVSIIDAVRNIVLDWALDLEKQNILGDGLSFSRDEVVRAAGTTNNFNTTIQTYHTVHGNVGVVGEVVNSVVTVQLGDTRALAHALDVLRKEVLKSDGKMAPLIAAAAREAVEEASRDTPRVSLVERLLNAIAATVQTIAAAGPAWAVVVTEAAKLGINVAAQVPPH